MDIKTLSLEEKIQEKALLLFPVDRERVTCSDGEGYAYIDINFKLRVGYIKGLTGNVSTLLVSEREEFKTRLINLIEAGRVYFVETMPGNQETCVPKEDLIELINEETKI